MVLGSLKGFLWSELVGQITKSYTTKHLEKKMKTKSVLVKWQNIIFEVGLFIE